MKRQPVHPHLQKVLVPAQASSKNRIHRILLAALLAGMLFPPAPHAVAAEAQADLATLSAPFKNALVVVEYELQYDKSDVPVGGIGAERCPNCGQFHGNDLAKYLKEERPVETPGYLVAPDRVVTKDPQLHPRFIKSISVHFRDQVVKAGIQAHALKQHGIILALESPLKDATPIKFDSAPGKPSFVVDLNWQLGRWCAVAGNYSESVLTPPDDMPYRFTKTTGVVLSSAGKPLGVILDGWIPSGESWQGSPVSWPQENKDSLAQKLAATQNAATSCLLRAHLGFRSPKAQPDSMGGYRSRFSRMSGNDNLGEDTTEADVTALVLSGGRLLVLANLDPKLTARLDKIQVHLPDGKQAAAKFTATLKDFGAFIATMDPALPGMMPISTVDITACRNQLLLRADISMHGESREEHFEAARFSSFNFGPKHRLYPEIDGQTPENAFLFNTDQQLVALSLQTRAPVTGERSGYDNDSPLLVPASYILTAVNQLPASADLSNIPVSEAEENRLAWIGAELQPLNQELARANGVSTQTRDGETGAIVTYVHPDSPAEKAGIVPGNVILRLKVAGRPLPLEVALDEDLVRTQAFPWERLDEVPAQYYDRIPTPWSPVENKFIRSLTDLGFGTHFTIEYFADGNVRAKEMEVVASPAHYESAAHYQAKTLGITVRDLTYEVRRYIQRKAGESGVVVSKVEAGGRAGVAGVRPFEIITHVNDQPVNNVSEFEALVGAGGELKLSVKRMAKGRIVTVKPDEN